MEVSGQIPVPQKNTPNIHCLPCHRDGLKEPACGYCQNCQEHICQTCFQHHKRATPSRNHILLDKDSMPLHQTSDDLRPDDITEDCTNHSDKPLEFYCNTHKSLACYVCVTLEHKQCKVDYIPDVSGNVSAELRYLFTNMELLVKKCESNIRKAQNATSNLDQNQEKVIKEIRIFRNEINAYLDEMESRIIQETESLVNTAKRKLENIKETCLEIVEELKCSRSFLNSLNEENKKNQQFVEMKKVGPRVTTLTDKERHTVVDNKTDDGIEFVQNKNIFDKLKFEKSLGMISTNYTPSEDKGISIQHERTIDLKSSSDKNKCTAYGMVLVQTSKMIVADYSNMKIKIVNVHNGSLESEIIVSSGPLDVAKLPQNKVAVAFIDGKYIQTMSYTETKLSLDRRIDIGQECYCVAYCQGKLIVGCGYNQGKLVILDLDGNIKQIFDTPGLFAGPEKIIISSDEKFLYISEHFLDTSRCIKMDWHGKILQRFQQTGYKSPKGIQVLEDTTLLVCYWESNTIVRLSSSCKICEVVGLEKENLLNHPRALAYSEKDHKLYVSCTKGDRKESIIKVFHVKWV